MTDPRNKAHDKKVQQEKKHNDEDIAPGADAKPQAVVAVAAKNARLAWAALTKAESFTVPA